MAGEYLEMDHDLPEKVKMVKLLKALPGVELNRIMGSLFLFWRFVDKHCNGPVTPGVTAALLCNIAGETPDFWQTVSRETGWLKFRKGDKLEVGGWDKRFSNSAKVRSASRRRKRAYDARQRAKQDESNGSVTQNVPRVRRGACAPDRIGPDRTGSDRTVPNLTSDRSIERASFSEIDWEEVRALANGHLAELGRLAISLTKQNRRLLLKAVAIIHCGVLPETWLADALEAAGEGKTKENPAAYLCTHLTNGAKDRGVDFATVQRWIKVPAKMLERGKGEAKQ